MAKVLYCAKRSRPDLLTRVREPTVQDYGKLQRLLKYVNNSRDLCLTLEAEEGWGLFAYIDASYGMHPDGKSHTGVCMLLGKGAFYVQSSKQKIVSKSSTESEIIAVSDSLSGTQLLTWSRGAIGSCCGVPGQQVYDGVDCKGSIHVIEDEANSHKVFLCER